MNSHHSRSFSKRRKATSPLKVRAKTNSAFASDNAVQPPPALDHLESIRIQHLTSLLSEERIRNHAERLRRQRKMEERETLSRSETSEGPDAATEAKPTLTENLRREVATLRGWVDGLSRTCRELQAYKDNHVCSQVDRPVAPRENEIVGDPTRSTPWNEPTSPLTSDDGSYVQQLARMRQERDALEEELIQMYSRFRIREEQWRMKCLEMDKNVLPLSPKTEITVSQPI